MTLDENVDDALKPSGVPRSRNEIDRTGPREHAHITRDKRTGEYRIFNDRVHKGGNCGTRIIRGGLSQEVHRNGRLEDGDEIHLGNAALRFTLN